MPTFMTPRLYHVVQRKKGIEKMIFKLQLFYVKVLDWEL